MRHGGMVRPKACRGFGGAPPAPSAAGPGAIRLRREAPRLLVRGGAQQGLDLLARCLIDPGDAVIVDRPGYLGAIQTFRNAGARAGRWAFARAACDGAR